ncbi:methyltransferase [Streptomyces tremellae]|uniref:Methyltransferase n=1 Tax=Streptomyces tremellae TaxID=1124239 RepID=A0ABP7F197_9ACTN
MAEEETPRDFAALMFDVLSYQAIAAAVRLGVLERLADGPAAAGELAVAAGAHEERMARLLRALVALRVLEDGEGRFTLTGAGRLLTRRAEGSEGATHGLALFYGDPLTTRVFGELESAVRGDVSAFRHVTGRAFFDYLDSDPEYADRYHRAMRAGAQMLAPFLAQAYPWGQVRRIVDVGGGDGTSLAALLAAHPGVRGTVFDTARAVEAAPVRLREAGVDGRCAVEAGSFLEKVPAGADAYLLKNVLHEWDDTAAVRILGNCRAAMADGGRVLIAATLLADPSDPEAPEQTGQDASGALYAAVSDIQLLCLSGQERTLAHYRRLAAEAGLRVTAVHPLPFIGFYHVIEAATV